MSTKHGNENYWCFVEDGYGKEVAIWKGPVGQETVIARAIDNYEAKEIVDGLIANMDSKSNGKLGKKETVFLEFAKANFPEPYATMASTAILWNDVEAYKNLISKFPMIYLGQQ